MKRILLLVPQGAELLETAAFTDVFGWDGICGSRGCRLDICSPRREIPLSFGRRLLADLTPEQVDPADFAGLALPGGFPRYGYFRQAGPELEQLIRSFHQAGRPIAAVCTGVLLLARAGLLRGCRAAVYQQEQTPFAEQLRQYGAEPSGETLTVIGDIITAAGPAGAVPAAVELLARCTSRDNAEHIRKIMGY